MNSLFVISCSLEQKKKGYYKWNVLILLRNLEGIWKALVLAIEIMCHMLVYHSDTNEGQNKSKKPRTFQGLSLVLPISKDGTLKIVNT